MSETRRKHFQIASKNLTASMMRYGNSASSWELPRFPEWAEDVLEGYHYAFQSVARSSRVPSTP